MKKTLGKDYYVFSFRSKIIRIMKITLMLALFAICSVAATSYAQNHKLTMKKNSVRMADALKEIEKSSEFTFFFNDNQVDAERKVNIEAENASINEVLDQIFKGTDYTYQIIDRQILVRTKKLSEKAVVQQQKNLVKGVVQDSNGEPIIGANVVVKGTNKGTMTDLNGEFSLEAPEGATLQISYIGYLPKEIPVKDQSAINVALDEDTQALEEVVIIGYGTVRKKDLTGSVSQLSANTMKDLKVSHPTQAMAGQMSGVQVQQVAGTPGQAATLRVRGAGSISASSSPLYVVDGYPLGEQNLNSINPSDIESIEVLKDASAAAIYGSRAANGVVLVTTKSGKAGKVTINLDAYYGFQNVTKKMDMLDAQEFAMISKEAFNNHYLDVYPNGDITTPLSSRPSGNRFRYPAIFDDEQAMAAIGKGTDWQDEIFRTAPIQNYQLTVSGGDQKTKYMFSAGYYQQDGIIIGSDYDRFSARAKVDSEFNSWLKVGVNLAPTYMKAHTITTGHWASDGVVNAALATSSIVPVRNEDGSWGSQAAYAVASDGLTGVTNAVANALDIENRNTNFRFFGNLYAELSLMKNLKFKTTIGTDVMEYRYYNFRPSNVPGNGQVAPLPSSSRSGKAETKETINWLNENTISYNEVFGLHEIDAVAGFTIQKNTYNYNIASGTDFPDDIIRTISNAKVKTGSSSVSEWALISYLGRINYRYNSRYYLTASIRADGSSRFGKNNRYGYFPSGSVAWRLSQEDFLKDLSWLSDLKIKASFGLTGTNGISDYAAIGTMNIQNYVFGSGAGNVVGGAAQKSFSNDDLTWEKSKQFDLGLEFSLFNSRISMTLDAYKRNTTDLLLSVDIPTITGFANAWQNIGEMENKGLELGINTVNITSKDLYWNTNFNFSLNRNKVLKLGPTGDPIQSDGGAGTTHITMIGKPIGSFYGYKQIGVYMNKADLDNSPRMSDSHVGDVKFADIDGNGSIDAYDRTIIGNNMPDFTWGMNNQVTYRNFDLSVMLQGVHGNEVLHLGKRFYTQLEGNQNQMKDVLNRWQSESNPGDGWTPRANSLTTGQNNAVSSRWVEDGSFIRINNLTLGWSLPKQFARLCSMQNARLYISIQNLATFSDYSGYSPETSFKEDDVNAPGTDYGMYPLARTYTFGVNVTF